eukprot:5827655-Pyramimonas_sp.AAC.1
MPHAFQFNRVVAVDTFFAPFSGRSVAFLNCVDHGTNYQVVAKYEGGAAEAWACFVACWLRCFGPPELLVCDGGPEFQGEFSKGLEQHGVFQHVVSAEAPWGNGRCERHGGWVKDLMVKGAEESMVVTEKDLETLAYEVVSGKNNYPHRGGFSPNQL